MKVIGIRGILVRITLVFACTVLTATHSVFSDSPDVSSVDAAKWHQISREVQMRLNILTDLIGKANARGIDTDYANVSVETIKAFQSAAKWDHENVEEVRRLFKTFRFYDKTDPAEADNLAGNEMKACVRVADHAIAELQRQMAGEISLPKSPNFAEGELSLGPGYYQLNNKVVFPYTIFWLPRVGSTMPDAFGRIGETYFDLSPLNPDGSFDPKTLKRRVDAAKAMSEGSFAPLYHFWGHILAKWMKEKHPDAMLGGRRFTQYDIDNPLVRKLMEQVCQGFLPAVADAYGDKPLLYLLANEPHFATSQGGWLVKNGQSKFTEKKYQKWLESKYGQIEKLNAAHNANHTDFASIEMPFPIPQAKRGGPVWYDWCRFNMDRVNDWFTFLKKTSTSAVQGHEVATTIKMLGHHLVDGQRDQGMDIEYLVNLQEVTGGDLRIQPHDATFYTHLEGGLDAETNWTKHYSYDWVGQAIFLDFVRSIAPEKPFFDSEWHGFGAVHWRHFELDRNYVRAALWHAFSNGMGMIEPWMWGRQSDGSLRNQADQIGELSTQPIAMDAYGRAMKELNAYADVFAAAGNPSKRRFMVFYSEESAIQNQGYADTLSRTYEAFKLLNESVGLTTPTHIKTLDPSEQIVIVPPTDFISDASLQTLREFQTAGGKIVLVGQEQSFGKTELGSERTANTGVNPTANVPMQYAIPLAWTLKKTLASYLSKMPVQVDVTDGEGKKAFGVFVQQATSPESGDLFVILNNASRDARQVSIELGDKGSDAVDAITGKMTKTSMTLEPYDVRLIKVVR